MSGSDVDTGQKHYLDGFEVGARIAQSLKRTGSGGAAAPSGPDAAHHRAQDRFTAAGQKLVNEEKAKREKHPFDIYADMNQAARDGEFPKGVDVFRWKFHGLFYVAPAEDSFMCRLRIPNGILTHWQFRGVADLAETYGGGYAHVTTRANLQVREIGAPYGIPVIEGLRKLGLTTKGAGADNIRNVTGGPTAGIDASEIIDTRPYADSWHYHILNDRSLYGLPRKFNVAFDGGGRVPVLEDTNDIGFQAVRVDDGNGVAPGVWFRLAIGGITGHEDFARDSGVMVKPQDATAVADAIVRVFIDHGDRTDRRKARLKYVLDGWGFEKYLAAVEDRLGWRLARLPMEACERRAPQDRQAHVGIHPQKQPGLYYIGVVLPVGKMTAGQMRALADIAAGLGDGDLRLTVWQNLLVSGVPEEKLDDAKARIEACGLDWRATAVRAGLIACTGNRGCRFSASDTKGHAEAIARHCEGRLTLDSPVNIHLTGCHHSCAQHYIGDIGLLGCRVPAGGDETVEGYHVYVGGGFGENARIARELWRDVDASDVPARIEALLRAYMDHRAGPGETFHQFAGRLDIDALRRLTEDER